MNVLLLGGAIFVMAALGGLALLALVGRRLVRAALYAAAVAAVGAAYGAALLATSLLSQERLLAAGETKRFCGFYLDCHLGVSVERVELIPEIGGVRASGAFHVLTLRVSSDARRATLRPGRLHLLLLDAEGRQVERARAAEAALARARGEAGQPLERDVVAGGSYTATVVFDVSSASTALRPRLWAREGFGLDRAIERVLIGDEDALLHRPVLLALPRPEPAEGAAGQERV